MTRRSLSLLGIIAALAAVCGADARGQEIVLKDGSRVPSSDFKVAEGKIKRIIKLPGGQTGETTLTSAQIMELNWPMPIELINARALMSQGKMTEALELLKSGREFFAPFAEIKGGEKWYVELYFAYVEALNRSGQFQETVKLLPELQALNLSDEQKTALKILKLDIERQTSSNYDSILSQAEGILKETDDSAVCASIWGIIGDIHTKKKEYEQALMAYLRIPVFYGTQVQRVPEAELNAARSLIKMKRYEDAQRFLTRMVDSYPGSAIADTASKEKAAINGMKNEDQPAPGEKKEEAGEKSNAATAEPSTESKS